MPKNGDKPETFRKLTESILGDESFWGINFDGHTGFVNAISSKLQELIKSGVMAAIKQISICKT